MELPHSFVGLLRHFASVLAAPTFQAFLQIVTCWVRLHRHRYVTNADLASGRVGSVHWCRFHQKSLGARTRPKLQWIVARAPAMGRGGAAAVLPSWWSCKGSHVSGSFPLLTGRTRKRIPSKSVFLGAWDGA
jgi:hypothetical protein